MNDQTEPSTLHEVLDAYALRVMSEHFSAATFKTRQLIVRRLKENHDDLPLHEITLDVCVDMIGHWRDRPTSAKTGKPIAPSTAQRTISELIRFFGWLDASDQFEWVAPIHFGQVSRGVDGSAS